MRTRIKICGITRPQDGQDAARLGADAIGLVFYAPSPRAVTIEQAKAICDALPPFVTRVGLFVNADRSEINKVLADVPLDLLQFHGDETPADCEGFKRPYIKALRMAPEIDVVAEAEAYQSAAGILLDSYEAGLAGGTGQTFDWQRVPSEVKQLIILAGGLNPQNVVEAIKRVRPYAVDVSGGVEAAKGIKDKDKMTAFINEVLRVGTS
ncbi:MAG: phosphoribosylanthranilate isomerase [Gammaproteobacteria bacterium]|nr:phosphoribosylanthranilate isomerase [Gammaproteobacteria bacterium]